MTSKTNASLTWSAADELSLEEYINERHGAFLRLLTLAKEKQEIDEINYRRLMMIDPAVQTHEDAFTLFQALFADLVSCLRQNAYHKLLERLQKGAKLINETTDITKKQRYMRHYDDLSRQAEQLAKEGIAV